MSTEQCGCTVEYPAMIVYCPLHKAAPKLLRLIEEAVEDDYNEMDPVSFEAWRAEARDAIEEAKEEVS